MRLKDRDRLIALHARLKAGEVLYGAEWRQYRKLITRARRQRGISTKGHAVQGHQARRVDDAPALGVYDKLGRLVPLATGRRHRC